MILVTGADGFVGTALVSELKRRGIAYRAVARKGREGIERNLARLIERGRIKPEERERVMSRIREIASLDEVREVDFVVEAVVEQEEAKPRSTRREAPGPRSSA